MGKLWIEDEHLRLDDGTKAKAIAPAVIAASRVTDIPAHYCNWFFHRLNRGYMACRTMGSLKKIHRYVSFANTQFIVFFSKNPRPLIGYLPRLKEKDIDFYINYTLNDYSRLSLEPGLNIEAPLAMRIDTFKRLSEAAGPERVVWHFDPLVLAPNITIDILMERISLIAEQLKGYTKRLSFGFLNVAKDSIVESNLKAREIRFKPWTEGMKLLMVKEIAEANKNWRFELTTCSNPIGYPSYGVQPGRCVDYELITQLAWRKQSLMETIGTKIYTYDPQPSLFGDVDPLPEGAIMLDSNHYILPEDDSKRGGSASGENQCRCHYSFDIGTTGTCTYKCAYCFAAEPSYKLDENVKAHSANPKAPSLTGENDQELRLTLQNKAQNRGIQLDRSLRSTPGSRTQLDVAAKADENDPYYMLAKRLIFNAQVISVKDIEGVKERFPDLYSFVNKEILASCGIASKDVKSWNELTKEEKDGIIIKAVGEYFERNSFGGLHSRAQVQVQDKKEDQISKAPKKIKKAIFSDKSSRDSEVTYKEVSEPQIVLDENEGINSEPSSPVSLREEGKVERDLTQEPENEDFSQNDNKENLTQDRENKDLSRITSRENNSLASSLESPSQNTSPKDFTFKVDPTTKEVTESTELSKEPKESFSSEKTPKKETTSSKKKSKKDKKLLPKNSRSFIAFDEEVIIDPNDEEDPFVDMLSDEDENEGLSSIMGVEGFARLEGHKEEHPSWIHNCGYLKVEDTTGGDIAFRNAGGSNASIEDTDHDSASFEDKHSEAQQYTDEDLNSHKDEEEYSNFNEDEESAYTEDDGEDFNSNEDDDSALSIDVHDNAQKPFNALEYLKRLRESGKFKNEEELLKEFVTKVNGLVVGMQDEILAPPEFNGKSNNEGPRTSKNITSPGRDISTIDQPNGVQINHTMDDSSAKTQNKMTDNIQSRQSDKRSKPYSSSRNSSTNLSYQDNQFIPSYPADSHVSAFITDYDQIKEEIKQAEIRDTSSPLNGETKDNGPETAYDNTESRYKQSSQHPDILSETDEQTQPSEDALDMGWSVGVTRHSLRKSMKRKK